MSIKTMVLSPRMIHHQLHHHHASDAQFQFQRSRKRSLPHAPCSIASNSSASPCDPQVPLMIAYLEQVTVDLSVVQERNDVRYVLQIVHSPTQTAWKLARSFDEYRAFQQRLIEAVDHGHFCSAECPWLFSFLKSYFPKKHIFNFARDTSPRVIAKRREALSRFFHTLQSFLLNRENHQCSIVTHRVASAFVQFVYGDLLDQLPPSSASITTEMKPLPRLDRMRTDSTTASSIGDEETHSQNESFVASSICVLCDSSLDGEAFSGRTSDHEDDGSNHCGSIGSNSNSFHNRRKSYSYTTTLGCGHQFHDECIVPKLNEDLRCPLCKHTVVQAA